MARLHQLPDVPGLTPWAAFESGTVGEPCAWVHLSHWHIGMREVTMTHPDALRLDEQATQHLMAAMAPYFAEDGIALSCWRPGVLLAKGDTFRQLRCVSVERVVGHNIRDWQALGGTSAEAKLRRLQNEMQMLLYRLPLNDEREANGLPPINSFWVTGAGVLDVPTAPIPGVEAHLLTSTEQITDACQRWAKHRHAGHPGSLTLCGDHAAQTFEPVSQSFFAKFMNKFGRSGIPDQLSSL